MEAVAVAFAYGLLVGVILFVWSDLRSQIGRLADRLDRHLEGHD